MFANEGPPAVLEQMRGVSVEALLLPLLIQLAVIIAAARLFAVAFRRIGQPAVIGEIVAGLALGPSLLGWLAPGVFQAVFRPAVEGLPPAASDLMLSNVLTALAQVGLVLMLFIIGMEFDFSHLRLHGRSAVSVAVWGVVLPFALGAGLGWLIRPVVAPNVRPLGFVLIMGTAMSITAIPVLGRIMVELGIQRTGLAAVTITAAAAEDAVGWVLLATVSAIVGGAGRGEEAFDPGQTARMLGATVAFGLFMALAARPVLVRFARWAMRQGQGELGLNALTVLLVVLFTCAAVTNAIGIFAIFGAFVLGAVLSPERAFCDAVQRRLRDLVAAFFLPLFFAYTGLRTNIGALAGWEMWGLAAAVTAVAVLGKLGGCALAARLGGHPWRESSLIGAMMNTRGLVELVVINVGKDLGLIPDSLYCMLVLMAIVTTFMTTPLLLLLARGTELEGPMRDAGFLGGGFGREPLTARP